ncbi:DUF1731 domain-containing protein [Janibacter alkaliphilus]|uniref:DUF1731 domain-containing protein n=1 Tax=Janibacter alkaliphilus TaxID=1069963 RepID=A0A852X6S9_9MICO|nr:DUF1731 domain-containing protein [Janibacter alkaliphilus]NYG38619.1 hypothetical protein [Janibacter alkaliphilus]
MPWTRTTSTVIALPPKDIWAVVADITRWSQWQPAVAHARLDGPLRLGVTGAYGLTHRAFGPLHARTAPPLEVTALETGRMLEITQPNPAGAMTVRWVVEADVVGTRLTQTVTAKGATMPAVVAGVAAALARDFGLSALRLARLAGLTDDPALLRVVVAGGSGALGRLLASDLACRGHRVSLLTRRRDDRLPLEQIVWDGRTVGSWADALERGDDDRAGVGLVNLAGRLVDVRPTSANIASLRTSRVDSTHALVEASQRTDHPLEVWVQASTTAIWSDAGEARLDETSPLPDPGLPQMTGVARPWEKATDGARADRLTLLRTSIVLDRDAPALTMLARPTTAGLGGRVGSGRQWFSWIHRDDWVRVCRAALGLDPAVALPDGPVVAAAPHPVRNAELMAALRRTLRRPAAPPTPGALLRIGAVALRSDPALALTGRHCTSTVLAEAGFTFEHPTIDEALADLYDATSASGAPSTRATPDPQD